MWVFILVLRGALTQVTSIPHVLVVHRGTRVSLVARRGAASVLRASLCRPAYLSRTYMSTYTACSLLRCFYQEL